MVLWWWSKWGQSKDIKEEHKANQGMIDDKNKETECENVKRFQTLLTFTPVIIYWDEKGVNQRVQYPTSKPENGNRTKSKRLI